MIEVLAINGWLLLLLFCLVMWLLVFVNNEFVVTEEIFDAYLEAQMQEKYDDDYNALASEFEDDLEEEEVNDSMWYDSLLDLGVITLQSIFQFGIISAFIFVGLTLANLPQAALYHSVFKVAIVSEYIFFIPKTVKYIWFIIVNSTYNYQDIKNFNPFSLYGLFDSNTVPAWAVYPLKFVNIFEILYVFALAIGISVITEERLSKVFRLVIVSYMSLMLLWIVVRIYIGSIF